MKKKLFCFLLLLITSIVISQNKDVNKAFDSVFYHVSVNVSSSNPTKAMYMADSILASSTTEAQRLKSIMLKADILEKQERRGEAILEAYLALKIAEKINNYSFQARIYGFLSTQYRVIGFWDKGKESLQKGIAASLNIEDKEQVIKYKAMANHEMAEYALEEKEYKKAIEYLELAILSYKKEKNETFKNFVIANSEEMLGRAELGLHNIEEAFIHFSRADSLINEADAGNTLWAALIYDGLGNSFREKKMLDSAEVYLTKALKIAENGSHDSLKERVYKSLTEYYIQINRSDSISKYGLKFKNILSKNNARKKEMVNRAYRILEKNPNSHKNKTKYIVGALIVFLIVGIGLYYKRNSLLGNSKKTNIKDKTSKPQQEIPHKTEQQFLLKLNEFEESQAFLDKDMSMSVLLVKLNTNTKYFRILLKKHRNKEYNNYITELRINYIVNKLKTDPKYLNYRISQLADESGFSSHSKFSADFKRVINQSPSEFINSLKS